MHKGNRSVHIDESNSTHLDLKVSMGLIIILLQQSGKGAYQSLRHSPVHQDHPGHSRVC